MKYAKEFDVNGALGLGFDFQFYALTLKLYKKTKRAQLLPINWFIEKSIEHITRRLTSRRGLSFPKRAIGGWWWTSRWRFEFLMGWLELPSVVHTKRLVRDGMIAIDVGAHVGYYSSLLSKLVGSRGKVYAFEACPENYQALSSNLGVINANNTVAINKAISDRTGKVELLLSAGHSTHSFYSYKETVGRCEVETTTLDAFVEQQGLPKVNFIKIDIEGAEPLALAGMTRTIERSDDLTMLIELNPEALRAGGSSSSALLRQLSDFGFDVKAIPNELVATSELQEVDLKTISEKSVLNLLCQKTRTQGR